MALRFAIFVLLGLTIQIHGQENINKNLAKSVQECYNTTELSEANMKMPMTMNLLIDLIRKVENNKLDKMDLKDMSSTFLYRFRQDGIRKAQNVRSLNIIPYSTSGHEFDKFRILLHKLVPGSQARFPNDTLTPLERCTIHHMLSESIETMERGDENTVCNQKEKYRLRVARQVPKMPDEVELIHNPNPSNAKSKSKGNIQISGKPGANPNADVDILPKASLPNVPASSCPLEYGVVYTKWGAVSAGNVLAGIAAGSEPQIIPVDNKYKVDNVLGATLAGDCAEAGYLSIANGEIIEIGADGNWVSNVVPHGYYLEKTKNFYLTNAEIRGSLDGLILGTKMKDYRNSVRPLKLSQLLDMYYSNRGVFSENIKACKRQELYKEYAPIEDMKESARGVAALLHKIATVTFTLTEDAIDTAVDTAVDKLDTYVPSNLRDVNCLFDDAPFQAVQTDLVILLDCSWNYDTVYRMLSYILDNADINPYNSNYTIINAQTGDIIIDSQNSIAEFHKIFNETFYNSFPKGFDLSGSVRTLENITRVKMEFERMGNIEANTRSLIGLFVVRPTNIDQAQKQYVTQRLNDVIKLQLPDLRLMALTSGPKEDFLEIVKDTTNDIVIIDENMNSDRIMSSGTALINRFKQIPNRVISYKCGSTWMESGSEKSLTENVEPNGMNFYRLLPNYFYGGGTRTVKIKGLGAGTLNVCHSRDVELPLGNGAQLNSTGNTNTEPSTSIVCKTINSDEFSIELVDACSGSGSISNCAPLYISVQNPKGTSGSSSNKATCLEKNCRFTDNIKYTITLDNMGCFNNANIVITNIFVLIFMLCLTFVRN